MRNIGVVIESKVAPQTHGQLGMGRVKYSYLYYQSIIQWGEIVIDARSSIVQEVPANH